MSDTPTLATIGKINGLNLKAAFGFGGAWFFWQMAVPGFEAFGLFAAIFAVGGSLCAARAVIALAKWLLQMRTLARFKRKGAAPKADRMADEDTLRAKGLTR